MSDPVVSRQRGCCWSVFLVTVYIPVSLLVKVCSPSSQPGPGGPAPLQRPHWAVLGSPASASQLGSATVDGLESRRDKQVPQVDLDGQIPTFKKQQSCLCI